MSGTDAPTRLVTLNRSYKFNGLTFGGADMATSRRKLLQTLGLTGAIAASSAVHVENAPADERSGVSVSSDRTAEKAATSLEHLAALIRSGEALVSNVTVHTDMSPNKIIEHTYSIDFALKSDV